MHFRNCFLLSHPEPVHHFRSLGLFELSLMSLGDWSSPISWLSNHIHWSTIYAIIGSVFMIEARILCPVHLYILQLGPFGLLFGIWKFLPVRKWTTSLPCLLHCLSQLSTHKHHLVILLLWSIREEILTICFCTKSVHMRRCHHMLFFVIIYDDIIRIDDILMGNLVRIVWVSTIITCKSEFTFLVHWLLKVL